MSHPEEIKAILPTVKFTPQLKQLQNAQKQNGIFFKTHYQLDQALKCFGKAHDALKTDYIPIFKSSLCHLELADIDIAKEEVIEALQLCSANHDLPLRHHLIDCVYNENHFENALGNAHNTLRLNDRIFNRVECNERIHAIRSTLDYAIGKHAGPCLLNLRAAVANLAEIWKTDDKPTKRVCGVSSDPNIARKKLKPLLKKRIEQNIKMIDDVYLLEIAHDYRFLSGLQTDERLSAPHTPCTNKKISSVVVPTVKRVSNWRTMLHTRQPIYSKNFNMIAIAKKAKEHHESNLNRIQYQTRRDVFKQLVKVRELAAQQKVSELVDYTISLLQYYYSIKTKRIFPRIFEFRNELCNIVSISFLQQIRVPKDLMTRESFERFPYLIAAKEHSKEDYASNQTGNIEFGNRAAFIKLHSVDTSYLSYKHRAQMLEQLVDVVETPIEKCLICYEVSRMHLEKIKIDEARTLARKVVENSEKCGNVVWLYLGLLQNTRCDAIQQNLGHIQRKLQVMQKLCYNLNAYIENFTRLAIHLNQIDIDTKEREEREKLEEIANEEAKRQARREQFLRMSIEQENLAGITPRDVRRHSEEDKNPRNSTIQ